jgi:hypothetical protein
MPARERRAYRLVLAIPLTLLTGALLLGCQEWGTAPIGTDRVGPEFSHKPGHGGGGGDDGGARKGDILTVQVLDGLVTSDSQEVEVTFINKRYFRVETGPGVHTFMTATNLDSTQALAEDVNGPCFTDPPDADSLIIDTLRARLVHPPRLRGFTMVVDKRGLDVTGTSVSWQNRLYTSWREPAFGLEDAPIHLQIIPPQFGDATVVLDGGSFDTIAEDGVDLTIKGGTLNAWTADPQDPSRGVRLLCPNVDEFKVFVRVPTP